MGYPSKKAKLVKGLLFECDVGFDIGKCDEFKCVDNTTKEMEKILHTIVRP
jgi:hypothetical protein